MPLTATGMRAMMRQLAKVRSQPLDGMHLYPSEDLSVLRFDLDGPEGTPFSEGRFHVCLVFDERYPEVPPSGYFRTKIFHPNVSDRGEICVNALKKDWNPQIGLQHIMLVIRCLLVEPNPESALNEEAGRLLLEDYSSYERKARMLTSIHAKRPPGVPRITHPDEAPKRRPTSSTTPYTASNEHDHFVRSMEGADHLAACGPFDTEGSSKPQVATASIAGPLDDPHAELPHPLRSLEGNNAYFASGKGKDDEVKAGGVSAVVRGSGEHGGAGCSASPAMMELHSAKAAQKKTTDKKKAALRRI
ncbi:unnamed protein product [Phytomonas sp. EM1]|nr:unnamed protein product [Phytomonas sp. EM1]|eukprot:CCW63679.1 unnamed protein product [Phytomonas sp. isolate EM1]